MVILSLFDGISCGQLALRKARIKYDAYFSSEIKDYAIQVAQQHFPNTIQVGDITNLEYNKGILKTREIIFLYGIKTLIQKEYEIGKIDLLIGGSPCQDFSIANSFHDGKGLEGEKSSLFYHYLRIKEACNPTYFLLENVKMKKEWKELIDKYMGVEAISINSSLVSGQNRPRLYWTNIPNIEQPKDKKISLQDLLEKDEEMLKKYKVNKTKSRDRMWNNGESAQFACKNITNETKSSCVTRRMDRSPNAGLIKFEDYCRFLTPLECERLQTIPENYTSSLIDSKRYDVIGDGWTVDVISHILSYLKKEIKNG